MHIVFKVGKHGVNTILKGFHPANQGDFLLVVLERDQGNPLPIQFNSFFPIINAEVVFMLPQLFIRGQGSSIVHITPNAIMLEDFHPLHNFLGKPVPNLLGVKPDCTIKDCVIIVSPKRKNFLGGKMFEGKFPIIPIVGEQPADPAFQGIFTDILQKAVEPLIKNLGQ